MGFATFLVSCRVSPEGGARPATFPGSAGPFGAFPSTAAVPYHYGLIPSRRSTRFWFLHPPRCRVARSRHLRVADLKVLLHSRVRCCARCCHLDAARCSLGLVPLLRFRRLLRSALRRGSISSLPSRKRDAPGGSRADWTREGGFCDWPEPAVHPAFRRHLSPGGQGGRSSQVLRARRVGGPLPPPVPEGSAEVAPSGYLSLDVRSGEPSGASRWVHGRSAEPKLGTVRPPARWRPARCSNSNLPRRVLLRSSDGGCRLGSATRSQRGWSLSERLPDWFQWPDLLLAGARRWPAGPSEPDLRAKCLERRRPNRAGARSFCRVQGASRDFPSRCTEVRWLVRSRNGGLRATHRIRRHHDETHENSRAGARGGFSS
jgi:hypothetical protein